MSEAESITPPTPRDMRQPRPLEGFGVVFAWELKRNFGRARFLVAVLLAAILCGFLGYQSVPRGAFVSDDTRYFELWKLLDEKSIPFLLPLAALIFVAQGFSREISQRTLVYHLVRPIGRTTVFLAKFFAGVLPGVVVSTVGLFAMAFATGVELPQSVMIAIPLVSAAGVTSLGALYYMLSALFKHGMVAGLLYTFAIEIGLASARGAAVKASMSYHMRSLVRGLTNDDFIERSERVRDELAPPPPPRNVDEMVTNVLSSAAEVTYETPATALMVMAGVTVVTLTIGAWRTARRDFPLKD